MPPLTLDDAVARADDLLQSVIADYPKHLETTFAEMKRSARSRQWMDIRIAAHDLQGQAATLGWPIIGLVACSLEAAIRTGDKTHFEEAARVHVDCMRLCLASNIRIPIPAAARFLEELAALVARMGKSAAEAG
jgi:HPt (histidine-containing phosphotransfer) domain-containing protein